MSDTILKIKGLNKTLGKKQILHSIDMECYSGEVYGFLGPNGAGKTTTIKIAVGLLQLDEGEISIDGKDIRKDFEGAMANVGGIVENPEMYKYLSGLENLRQYARMREGVTEERIKEVVELVRLSNRINDKVSKYSLGMRQRLGVAQAILHRPKLLILDEPTNGLDPNQIVEIRHLIKSIAEERTVILSTHILSEVQATCDYIRMIEEGQVVFAGTVEEFDNYIVPNTIFVSLASAPPVDELKMLSGVEDAVSMGGMDYRVNFSDSREAITQIVEASVTRNWQLLEIRMEKSSMDSVFAELSAKSKNR